MKRHPFAKSVQVKYWYLNRKMKQRGESLEIEKVSSNYLKILKTTESQQILKE